MTYKAAFIYLGLVSATLTPGLVLAQSPTLDKIKASGTVTIGHRETSVPLSFVSESGKVTGYAVELCELVVDGLKKQLDLPALRVRYLPVNPQTRIPLIANGTVDMECGTTTITLGRQQQVDFSNAFYLTGTRMAVKRTSPVREIEDLAGKTVGFAQGTTDERIVRELATKQGIQNIRAVNFKDQAEGMLALETDRVDAFIADDVVLFGLISKSRNRDDLAVVGRFLSIAPYGIMMRRNDADFRLAVNRALAGSLRTGEVQSRFERYFKPLGVPLTTALQTAFDLGALQD